MLRVLSGNWPADLGVHWSLPKGVVLHLGLSLLVILSSRLWQQCHVSHKLGSKGSMKLSEAFPQALITVFLVDSGVRKVEGIAQGKQVSQNRLTGF